ncbi:MAG: GTP cyclohydrolase [Opitutales bacterium]
MAEPVAASSCEPALLDPALEKLREYARHAATHAPSSEGERATYGTTVFIAETKVPTRFGDFQAYIFQDIIHKGYVLTLTYGDVRTASRLHTRMHSSCVTSETLRGCDCDCVQQLEGAMKKIAEEGQGVLFYLLQEGRGVGYTAKARDRMLVQASRDTLSTFEAYDLLGLRKDYRQYRNVGDIVRILGISADWVVLTNNPDKIEAMTRQGMTVARAETLEYEPEPFNLFYLQSKAESGHYLKRPLFSVLQSVQPPEPVVPFKPRVLPGAERFIYMASYFLPVRPIDNEILLGTDEMRDLFPDGSIDEYLTQADRLVHGFRLLRKHRALLRIDYPRLKRLAERDPGHRLVSLLYKPYWFRVHVYYDIVSGHDVVVLTHGQPESHDVPVVRIQSESILNRFPVKVDENKAKYMRAIQHIVDYGVGAIVLVYQDGRGAGFGAFAMDRMMLEQGRSYSTAESYAKLGVDFDEREYDSIFNVLRAHLPSNKIKMVMNSPNSLVAKGELATAIREQQLDVVDWIFLDREE